MAQLSLTTQFQSGTGSVGVSAHEPNGEFWTYRVSDRNTIETSMARPDPSVFHPFASPDTAMAQVITVAPADNVGTKKFLGWGTGAYYHQLDSQYSFLVLPIHRKANEQESPLVQITNRGNTVIFDIAQNDKIEYDTVRLTVRQGNLRDEKIVYFKKDQPIHYEMVTAFSGMVTASVRAHADEINIISRVTETSLDMGTTLESTLAIDLKSATQFTYDPEFIKFSDADGLSVDGSTAPQTVSTKIGVYLPFGTTADEPTLVSAVTGAGTAVISDWEQVGNRVKVELTLTKPDIASTVSVSKIIVPFHKSPAGSGSGAVLQQATETVLGGVRAKARTTESSEVAIDPDTGKLYASDSAYQTAQAGGYTGTESQFQIDLASIESLAAAINAITGG